MKGIKSMKLGLLATGAVAALVAGLVLVAQVQAIAGTAKISSATAAPGGSATVELRSNVPGPLGLGAWTIDITYDPAVASVSGCDAGANVCNGAYPQTIAQAGDPPWSTGTVRMTGGNANGLEGDSLLGSITFLCANAEDVSALTITVSVFSDSTVGSPQPIDETVTNGTLTCAVPPTPGATVAAAGSPTALPPTGSYGTTSDSDGSMGWIIAGLAGAGLAAIAGFGALRLRTRRS